MRRMSLLRNARIQIVQVLRNLTSGHIIIGRQGSLRKYWLSTLTRKYTFRSKQSLFFMLNVFMVHFSVNKFFILVLFVVLLYWHQFNFLWIFCFEVLFKRHHWPEFGNILFTSAVFCLYLWFVNFSKIFLSQLFFTRQR